MPLGLTAGRVAKACGIARTRIERIVAEEIGISGDTALRLGRVFGTGPELWMNLQSRYEIESARAAMDVDLGDHATAETLRQAIACYPAPPNLIAGLHRL